MRTSSQVHVQVFKDILADKISHKMLGNLPTLCQVFPPGRFPSICKGPMYTLKLKPPCPRPDTKQQTQILPLPSGRCERPLEIRMRDVRCCSSAHLHCRHSERRRHHGHVPPPSPSRERSPEWQKKTKKKKALSNPLAHFQARWLMKPIAMTSMKWREMGRSLNCQVCQK